PLHFADHDPRTWRPDRDRHAQGRRTGGRRRCHRSLHRRHRPVTQCRCRPGIVQSCCDRRRCRAALGLGGQGARPHTSQGYEKKKSPGATRTRGPSGFCLVINPDSFYAAISRYSSGRSSNSFLHSSEQKKYFFPANRVRNSDSLSSTRIPQTGSVVMIPPLGEFVLWSPLTAMTFPFSAFPQVTEAVHLSRLAISSA